MKTVLVIGGGITGLSALYELQKWKLEKNEDVELILAEASDTLGGKIRTVKTDGFAMEVGADSIVARKAISMPFIKELGLESDIVYNATGVSFLYTEGELKPIPADTIFGIPMSVESLRNSTLISAEGKEEALNDLHTKNETFTKNDSVGDFLEHFFGKELVEKQIGPVLSGVYSGTLKDLTIAATLPFLIDYKNEYGSIIKGLEANKEKFQSKKGKFISFQDGMSALIDAYERKLETVNIHKNHKAVQIEKQSNQYKVTFENDTHIVADHVVLSIPHTAAVPLLKNQDLKEAFASFKNSSLISVYLGFNVPDSILPEDGTGFISTNSDNVLCNACTWTSRKWEHTSDKGNLLVRLFYKSSIPSFPALKQMNKSEILQVALKDIEKSLGIEAQPVVSEVTDWVENMPTYQIAHPKDVATLEERLNQEYPGVILAGCSYYGVGIADCIENGEQTANKIVSKWREEYKECI
ncbi:MULTISPECIES: protoporphyrinogen oxidase [Bacillus]|uniref:protoporphyrinogen oxidase n=1 Tax=Bacillus TaxID=1386 RepID=UPI000BB84BD5|nr:MULTISPECIES: protoporphyrinogen oxidase [Bacillus]